MKKLSFMKNTIVLVISNLLTGSLSFIFSIILSKELGAQGVGLFQMIMPIYVLFICLTCGGVITALSKIIAELNSKKNTRELYKSISVSIVFFSFWTIFVSLFIILFASFLSVYVVKDSRTYISILIFVPALLFVTISSALKGYFYGLQNTTFPAVIDIVEKAIRIIILIALLNLLKDYELKYKVSAAVAAMTIGEFVSLILLYIFYKRSYLSVENFVGTPDNVFQIVANVLTISLPLCINGFLSTALGAFIAVMIPRRLQSAGFTAETSLALYGKISGMSLNIIMFPAIIIGAISIVLVPAISEASTGRNKSTATRKIYYAIKVTTAIAAMSAGLFFSLPHELGKLFYNRTDLGNIIFSLSFGVLFIYVEFTLFGILNGLGKQGILLRNTMIMSAIDIVSLYILLGIPEINIYGYAINFVISPLVGCILNGYEIRKITNIEINITEMFIFPIILSLIEITVLKNIKDIVPKFISNSNLTTVIFILIGAGVYGIVYLIVNPYFKSRT